VEALAIFFIQSIIGGVTGNRADDLTTAAYERIAKRFKKSGIPQNHDIERAIRKSYLLATIAICSQILKTENKKLSWRAYFSSNEISKWLNKVIDGFKNELHELYKPNYIIPSRIGEIDSSIFISRKNTNNNETYLEKALENELMEEIAHKFGKIPEHIVCYFKSEEIESINSEYQTWYELLCAFFSEQLKTDTRLRSIFDAQVLADIKHVGLSIPMEKVEYRLNQIGEKTLSAIEAIRKDVGLNIEIVDRIESQLFEIQILFKNNFNNKGQVERLTVSEKYAGYETYRKQSIRINDLASQPIFGREQLFKNIDDFIVENNSGTILITAPAGFGKSVILASWLTRKKSQGLYIVSHFFSSESQSSLEGYSNLVSQILGYYKLESEILPNRSDLLRDMLIGLIEKESPNKDQPLIIVIDGLDESDVPFGAISSAKLPESVFIIASIRTNENFDIPEAFSSWRKNNFNLSLQSLNSEDLVKWLSHLSISFQDISTLADLCIKRTDGFPLYVRFLFDEIKNTNFSSYEVLEKRVSNVPLGFATYVREQFNILAGHGDVRNRREFQELFSLLTVALGPLGEKDIESILNLSSWNLYALPWPIVRWLNIQDIQGRKTYKFIHPLLANVFAEILGKESIDIENRLLRYCENWKTHQSLFTLQYYIPHLLKANRYQDAINLVVDNKEWMIAKRSKFKNDKSLVQDIDLLVRFIQEQKIDNWFQSIVQLSALNETILKRASSFQEIDVSILIYQGRLEDAMEIVDAQITFNNKLRFNLTLFFALRNIKQNTIEEEQKILDLFSNPSNLEKSIDSIAAVLRKAKDVHLDFTNKFAQYIFDLDSSKLEADNKIHLYGLIFPYLNDSSQSNLLSILSKLLNENEIIINESIAESLARTGHHKIEQYLLDLTNSHSINAIFISDLSTLLPPRQKALKLKLFDWLWGQILYKSEIALPITICIELGLSLSKIGEMEPSRRILKYIIEEGKKGKDIEYALYFIGNIIKQDCFEGIFDLFSVIKESAIKLVLKAEIACQMIHNKKQGSWYDWLTSVIENIENIEILDQKDVAKMRILSATIEVNKIDPVKNFNIEIIALAKSIVDDKNKLSAIKTLIKNDIGLEVNKLIGSIQEIEKIAYQDIGDFVEVLYQFGFNDLGKQFYDVYKDKRQKYELYENRRLSLLSELSDNLGVLGNSGLSDAILEHAYELAKMPADPNYLRNDECNRLVKSLIGKGWNDKVQELSINEDFVYWDEFNIHNPQKLLRYFQETPLDKNNYPTQVGKMLHKAYLELHSSDDQFNTQLNQTIENLAIKFNNNIINEILSGYYGFLLLLIKENVLHDKILESIVIELFYNHEIKSITSIIFSLADAAIVNGYYEFAWEIVRNEDLERYHHVELGQIMPNIDKLFAYYKKNLVFKGLGMPTSQKSKTALEKVKIIQDLYCIDYDHSHWNSVLFKVFDLINNKRYSLHLECNNIQSLHLVTKILGWEDSFMENFYGIISNTLFEDKDSINLKKEELLVAPCHKVPDSINAFYFYLQGIKMYREGQLQESLYLFNKVTQYESVCTSAAYLLSGNIKFILQDYEHALYFFDLVTVSSIKGYAEGMTLRTLLLQNNNKIFKTKIEKFKATEPEAYYGWKTLLEIMSGSWNANIESCSKWLKFINKKDWTDNYCLGTVHYYKALSYHKLGEVSSSDEAFEKLLYHFNEENYYPCKLHLALLIKLLHPETPIWQGWSVETMLKKGFLCRLGFSGFRAYINSIVDLEIIKHIQNDNFNNIQIEIFNSLKFNGYKIDNVDISIESPVDKDLLFDEAVVLLRGTNLYGEGVFSYVKLSLRSFRKLRDAMLSNLNFTPSDFGEVIFADYGSPSYELVIELKFKNKMVAMPKRPRSVWEID